MVITIGLTEDTDEIIEHLVPPFDEKKHAAHFAMAYAINRGVEPGTTADTSTVWNIGSFDPDMKLKSSIKAIYPEIEESNKLIEHFVNEGLLLLDEHRSENETINLEELIPVEE